MICCKCIAFNKSIICSLLVIHVTLQTINFHSILISNQNSYQWKDYYFLWVFKISDGSFILGRKQITVVIIYFFWRVSLSIDMSYYFSWLHGVIEEKIKTKKLMILETICAIFYGYYSILQRHKVCNGDISSSLLIINSTEKSYC